MEGVERMRVRRARWRGHPQQPPHNSRTPQAGHTPQREAKARGKDDTIEQASKCTVHLAIRSEHLAHLIKLSRNAELFERVDFVRGSGKKGGKKQRLPVLTLRVGNHVARRVAQRSSLAAQGSIEAEGTYRDVGVLLWKLQAWTVV
jgi:hypothetical protein